MGVQQLDDWQIRLREISLTWIRTPYQERAQVKGPSGGVDCATFLIGVFSEAGLIEWFKPDYYSGQEPVNSADERYMNQLLDHGAFPVKPPWQVGDILMFKALTWLSRGHSALYIGNGEVIHAHWRRGVETRRLEDPVLRRSFAGGYRGLWVSTKAP